jgi:DNA polymerase III subunit delta
MKNLFLFTGEETYFLRKKVRAWQEAFREKHGDFNLSVLDGDTVSLGEIMTDATATPFLGEKRLIFVENLPVSSAARKNEKRDEALKTLPEKLKDIPESSVVVFVQPKPDKRKAFYKSLFKVATVETFKSLDPADLTRWIQAEVRKAGGLIDRTAADYLISMTGQSCWRLSKEIEKLTSFCLNRAITKHDIDHIVSPSIEANVFHFTDALGAKDHKKAIANLHRSVAAGENLRQLFYMIVRQFRLLLQVKSYKDQYPATNPASMASSLKIHAFVARTVSSQTGRFDMTELTSAYGRLLELDHDLKTSRIKVTTDDQDELALAIERFILQFCCT